MRRIKASRQQQSWGFLFSIVLGIAALSLLVLVLMGAGLTGFVVLETFPLQHVNLSLETSTAAEGSLLEGIVFADVEGPLDSAVSFFASLGNNQSNIPLTTALDLQSISYTLTQPTPQVEGTSPTTTLYFTSAGTQQFVLRLPQTVQVQNMSMQIRGLAEEGQYPSYPKIDANGDGDYEWVYLGDFLGFNETYLLPVGLRESSERTITITEQNVYYCELMNLPRGREFLISAKYLPLQPSSAADLEIVFFSASSTGQGITGYGGTDACDLDEQSVSTPTYASCSITLEYPLAGNHLVCVHNAGLNLPEGDYYELSQDIDSNSGYRCGAVANGRTTCVSQQGDFFIKIQPAVYDGLLDRQTLLAELAPTALLPAKLNEQLQRCTPYEDFCYLPLYFRSESQGALYLDALDLLYSDRGTLVHERNFYTLSTTTSPVITTLDNVSLTSSNYSLSLPLSLLGIEAPNLPSSSTSRNYTLTAGFTPGSSATAILTVTRSNATTNATFTGNFTTDASFYQQLLTSLLQEHEQLLTFGGFTTKLASTLQSLSTYISLSTAPDNISNISLAQLEDTIMDSLDVLPQYLAVKESSTFTPSVSTSDFKDSYVYPQQRDEDSKQRLAYLQQQYTPTVTATVFEVITFDKDSTLFTVVEHSASLSSGRLVLLFPSGAASSLQSVSFSKDPTTTLSTSPLAVSWDADDLPATLQYVLKGNLLSTLQDLRVFFIPEVIPEAIEQPRTTCGDGVCSVLMSNGQKIALEDKASCPADCGGGGVSWTWTGIILLLAVLLLYYFGGLYKGPGNFQTVLQRMKKQGTKPSSSKLFSSSTDEATLKNYVQNALKKGVTKEAITSTLLNRGWTKQQIDAVLKQVKP